MERIYLDKNVLSAAKERISWTFDSFENICLSFSGGKDSTVMMHLVMEEAIKRNRKISVMFIDWECQFTMTIEHIRHMFELYKENIIPYWIQLPIRTWNGCSMHEPEWIAWDEDKKGLWVRDKEKSSIKDEKFFPFYIHNMMFEEFTPLFGQWLANNKPMAQFVGIRTGESLNRYRAIARSDKINYQGKRFTTNVIDDVWNVYPIYDFETKDDWRYFSKFNKCYNKLYDRMYQAGMTISSMRIDEPFGDTQRRSLWLYQVIEPSLWAKMVARVAGANTGALYSKESGNILGNMGIKLPEGYTWKSFAEMLLYTIPKPTAEHYKNKIAKYINWFKSRGYPDGIPDEADLKLETYGKAPSWRRVCKTLLRNDYWCKGLGFSPTKSDAYKRYCEMMKKKRNEWNLFPIEQGEEK